MRPRFEVSAYRGVLVPLVSPFRDGELDLGALRELVHWLLESPVRGFLCLGTTGEAPHLDDAESERVVRTTVEAVAGRVPVLAGSGRASTQATIDASQRLAQAGADAMMVLTPYYYRARMDGEALHRHYFEVADACPVPVFVYHMPEVTGLDVGPDLLSRIVRHPNVWGFKDSAASEGPLAETLRRVHTCALVGSGACLLEGLEAGAAGGILAVAHLVPEICTGIDAAWRAHDLETARDLQQRATSVTMALRGWGVPGLKHGLELRGKPAGVPRAPLAMPPADVRARIETALRSALDGKL